MILLGARVIIASRYFWFVAILLGCLHIYRLLHDQANGLTYSAADCIIIVRGCPGAVHMLLFTLALL